MSYPCKVRAKIICCRAVIAIVFLITLHAFGSNAFVLIDNLASEQVIDTPPPTINLRLIDTINAKKTARSDSAVNNFKDSSSNDSIVQTTDTVKLKLSKDTLDAPVVYSAEDSGVLIIPTKEFILYGKAKAKYTDVEVNAETINLNQDKQLLVAFGTTDTTGNPLNKPKLVQGDMQTISDTIYYNTKSQKGLTKSTYLQQGEMYVYANTIKKVSDNTIYAWKSRFTTCNLDTPHFAFRTRRMKMINNKMAISGPTSPEFEGVPVPIGIPFGIYPLNRGRHSGLLPPQFANNEQFGLGLEGLGYYQVLNDNFDLTVLTNLYSYGGWRANVASRYLKRYKYNGNINLSVQYAKILNSDNLSKQEFTTSRTFLINWSHSKDSKARPGTSFSANVNAGSTKYNQFVANNATQNFQNSLNSSITYTKDWDGKYNLTLSANHSQNNNLGLVNLSLPNAAFNMVTIYPFQKKEGAGTPKWYEKLGVGYSGSLQNQIAFYDSAFSLRQMIDTAAWGIEHNVPITLSLPQLGPVLISPSVSYEERWYAQRIIRTWDTAAKRVDTTINKGIYTARQMQFGISASTRIFGTLQFKGDRKIKAIRHEIRPTISVNYRPDMQKRYYRNVQTDTLGNIARYSQFEGGILGPFSEGRFGGIGFGVENLLEMKVRNKKDTSDGGTKKVKLIDGFGFNGSYNLIPGPNDLFPLSNISLYARSNLFEKINVTATANMDPYQLDSLGNRIPKLMIKNNAFKPGRITNGSIALSTSLQSKRKDGKTDKDPLPQDNYMTPDEQQRQLEFVRSNPAEFTDFNIPWTVQLSYSLSFSRILQPDFSIKTQTFSNLSVTGDFSLSPKWKVGGNSYYDFTTKKVQTLSMFITRDMHCWQMAVNITPVGLFRSFSLTINPKSGILRDLKINRTRSFYQ